jgi:chromo domain-containing protein 1
MSLDFLEGNTTLPATANRDDDDISITSTVPSEPQSEYEVETICCEEEFEDGVKYLVKWKGYPDERCSWETGEMFNYEETLRKWKRKRRAIQRGEVPAFDIEGWYDKIDAWVAAEEDRKRRRRLKRLRCGLPVSDDEGTREENPQASGNENTTQSDEDSDRPMTQLRRRPAASSLQARPIEQNQSSELRSASTPKSSSPKSKQQSLVRHNESTRGTTKERASAASSTRAANPRATTRQASSTKPSGNARPRAALENPVSFGRSQGPAQRRDILGVISRRRAQRARGEADGKQWKNMSTTRRYEKAARYEPEPDVNQLELRRPSNWIPLRQSPIMRRPKDNDSLFVEQDDTSPVQPESQPRRSYDVHSSPRPPIPRTDSLDSKYETPRSLNPPAPTVDPTVRHSVPRPHISLPESWTQHYVAGVSKVGKTTDDSGEVHSRKWKKGQLLVHLYYGTNKFEVGDVLLHNISHGAFRDFMDLKDRDSGRVEIWFQETWSLEKFNLLIKRVRLPVISCRNVLQKKPPIVAELIIDL